MRGRYGQPDSPLHMVMTIGDRFQGGLRQSFRLPGQRDPAPHPARLAGVCSWAAALGLLGLPVAARASVAIIAGAPPGWFEPAVVTVGLVGIGLTVASFSAIHCRRLPWLLLAAATAALATNLAFVYAAG